MATGRGGRGAVTALEDQKTSKLSFRARAVDANRKMPIFSTEELTDLSDYASVARGMPQLPSGMEKEEENEHHLQQAISARQRLSMGTAKENDEAVIPIPKITAVPIDMVDKLYSENYKPPKHFIKVQAALNLAQEAPDYDLDSEDEKWLEVQEVQITETQFERVMDTLEKQSEYKVIKPGEAKSLLQEDDDLLLAVYDYWLAKRYTAASQGRQLIPRVKTDRKEITGTSNANNPYVAFRRRAEKMQTRKNRKNDEESYERMLRLRMDLQKAVTLSEMIKRRETSKRESVNLGLDIMDKRLLLNDFNESLFAQIRESVKPSFQVSKHEMFLCPSSPKKQIPHPQSPKRKKPQEDHGLVSREWLRRNAEDWNKMQPIHPPAESTTTKRIVASHETEEDPAGLFTFKRHRGCKYYAPQDKIDEERSPWEDHDKYYPSYLHSEFPDGSNSSTSGATTRFVGLVRRRMGRGGRLLFDRVRVPVPGYLPEEILDDSQPSTSAQMVSYLKPVKEKLGRYSDDREDKRSKIVDSWCYRPRTPVFMNEYINSECSTSESNSKNPHDTVPFATVMGPSGTLTLPMTIGPFVDEESNDLIKKKSEFTSVSPIIINEEEYSNIIRPETLTPPDDSDKFMDFSNTTIIPPSFDLVNNSDEVENFDQMLVTKSAHPHSQPYQKLTDKLIRSVVQHCVNPLSLI